MRIRCFILKDFELQGSNAIWRRHHAGLATQQRYPVLAKVIFLTRSSLRRFFNPTPTQYYSNDAEHIDADESNFSDPRKPP